MQFLLGDAFPAFLASYDAPAQTGLRVNTLKVTPENFCRLAPFELTPSGLGSDSFIVAGDARPGRHPYHAAGLYYLQDPSAMTAAVLLDPQPGERVLDLAAAPGGKATHIAARLAGQGVLFANELHPKRVWDLAENLERWGVRNVVVLNEDPARLADRLPGYFDRVLLDAPCSGEGLFRKTPAARRQWSPTLVAGSARRQALLLAQAARLVRTGGILTYATCTFAPEEDEAVVAEFLDGVSDYSMVAPARVPAYDAGRPDWVAGGVASLRHAVRLWPHTGPGEGHFVAVMQRHGDRGETAMAGSRHAAGEWAAAPRAAEALFHAFIDEHLTRVPVSDRLVIAGSYLYTLPENLPDLSGLRVIHPGWWLGVLHRDRFEPSHALALGLTPADVQQTCDLTPDDPGLAGFLTGQPFRTDGAGGWVMVTVDGFPVGWGKRSGGVLKSHYPKGLRRLASTVVI
jgi:NOL1/NOP2/sun family putative RNA methylase